MVISQGYYDYSFFNICFLNNMLCLSVKALTEGYLPQINIINSEGINVWETFFEQPFADITRDGKEVVVFTERYLEIFPQWGDVNDSKMIHLYGELYNNLVVLRPEVNEYVQNEVDQILSRGKVLGVICRGTDYTKTKPKGHPIQPEPEEILRKVEEVFLARKYDYIYLATEDSFYDDLFRKRFGNKMLVNKRQYYDKIYGEEDIQLIKDVHFDRENDNYLKGLEYLSSLIILSKCNGLIAGNCCGTEASVFWNNGEYEDKYVFDLGEY